MNRELRLLTSVSLILLLGACTAQELGKFAYNTGNNVGCRHANDNLPNEKLLDLECANYQGDNGMSYERYIEIRNEIETEDQ